MTISVNGKERQVQAATTLSDLVAEMGLAGQRLALERNRELVPRREWAAVSLEEGDRIEMVEFVGGGSGA